MTEEGVENKRVYPKRDSCFLQGSGNVMGGEKDPEDGEGWCEKLSSVHDALLYIWMHSSMATHLRQGPSTLHHRKGDMAYVSLTPHT